MRTMHMLPVSNYLHLLVETDASDKNGIITAYRGSPVCSKGRTPMSGFLVNFILMLFQVLSLAILGRVLLSWVDPMGNMRITQILRDLTEPILAPIRSLLPSMPMFDFSPIIAMLLLQALGRLVLMALQPS